MEPSIRRIFAEIPHTYEIVNHILTLGLDILWRRNAVRMAVQVGGNRWVDVCSGTGETAAYLKRSAPSGTGVYAVDFVRPMLDRIRQKPGGDGVTPVLSDIKGLPFPDDTFDLVTISFATRNINLSESVLIHSFREFRRVLKPGGMFLNLETSQPPSPLVRWLFHLYVRLFVRAVGRVISGSTIAYAYLAATIPRFYGAEELTGILEEAGFVDVGFRRMTFGAVAAHIGWKRRENG
ncbi:MAG: ubiquinone/menaquinone biosynthesis methyltransferase [bacterium]|nr:MAG: ubiquinone/menaquinone biosynthesis methyltransferase [bacterium]